MRLEVKERLADVAPEDWNALVGDGSAFLEWEWLSSLEDAGCVSARTGWLPQHLTLWNGRELVGACPLYVKAHSMGEFVFDHGWAEAAENAGIAYYPKLLVGVPFTPATGARFLSRPGCDRVSVVRALGEALKGVCRRNGFSSVHVNFCLGDEVAALTECGFEHREGYQYQWTNLGWQTFDDYVAALKTKRRTQVRRERRELGEQGIAIDVREGAEVPADLLATMFRLYQSTIDKLYWGRQYLNSRFFDLVGERWRRRLCLIVARRGDQVVAGTFNVRKGGVLYGRYWGTFEELRFLHFNVCYYAAIEHCVRQGMERFEPGAGGEFKHLRGFDAAETQSMHWIRDPRFRDAVADYLDRERAHVAGAIAWFDDNTALKRER
ncbi:MAG: GNAT family N-acetyltransferase [Candidatus Binatia bacterium]